MIPLHLRISGFLSYRDPAELDFTSFDLACISGHNGAGKSSLLDAITWSLFGEARGKSSDVINLNPDVKAAEVALTFQHEDNTYRVQRTLPRNKSTILEFQIKNDDGWRPLTEKTTRDTQARIEQTLRLDFETFVNASFFLQGRADQFTQQNAGRRKEVLSNILGLEMWEEYKNRSAERRKLIERDVNTIEARIAEIDTELAERALQDLIPQTEHEIPPPLILEETARYFSLSIGDLVSKSRSRPLTQARHIAMYLVRECTGLSLVKIGEIFGGRDHTTVLHGINKVEGEMRARDTAFRQVQDLTRIIRGRVRGSA